MKLGILFPSEDSSDLGLQLKRVAAKENVLPLLPPLRDIDWLNVLNLFAGPSSAACSLDVRVPSVLDLSSFYFISAFNP